MALNQTYINYALQVQATYGVPASVCLGQFIYESAAGTSHMARVANNCFGIKGKGNAGSYVSRGSSWRKYKSKLDSFLDWGRLVTNSNYSRYVKGVKDPKKFLQGLVKGGYCSDAGYVSAVMAIISKNGLTKYDKATSAKKSSSSGSSSKQDIVSVAQSQIGSYGSDRNKFAQYTGHNGQPWCASFVSWCAGKAGVSTSVIPSTASVSEMLSFFKNKGQFHYKGSYKPVRGDICIFKNNNKSHVGIVVSGTKSSVTIIEGNATNNGVKDWVKRSTYSSGSIWYGAITGYGHPSYSYIGTSSSGSSISSGSGGTDSEAEIAYLKKILEQKKPAVDLSISGTVSEPRALPECDVTVTITNSVKVFNVAVKEGMKLTLERGEAGKLVFEVHRESGYKINEGNSVLLTVDGTKIFYGFVFAHSHSKDMWVEYTAYDQLRYLKNKDTLVYTNKRADQLIRIIANRFNLKCGTLANTGYARSAVEEDSTLMDMIQNALDDTMLTKNRLYVIYDKAGELRLRNVANMKVNTCLIDARTGQDYTYKASIDSDVYNQIKLVYENEETGTYDYYVAKSSKLINSWGVLQLEETIDSADVGRLKSQAYLKLYSQKQVTLKISGVIGNKYVRGGSLVPVTLDLPDATISNYMLVDKAVHEFKNHEWTMDLNVSGGDFSAE